MKLYREVKASERLPEAGVRVGILLQQPEIKFPNGAIPIKEQLFHSSGWVNNDKNWLISDEADRDYKVIYWLEPIEITEEEIEEAAKKWEIEASAGMAAPYVNEDFIAGANWSLSKLKGE